ncbi:hypothetical protein [Streptomyces sp. SID13726]|uniref:hypothetical protein n=1 Tax=Streptomyces sp. SID13726 TaxID=2706058 RepID=UPI0013BE4558|nr:hypothetical protein [Streptomyces sp. SID13726]
MNTERPDNDEASGGGDGSAAEVPGAGGAGGTSKEEHAGTRPSGADGTEEGLAGEASGTSGAPRTSGASEGAEAPAGEVTGADDSVGSSDEAAVTEPEGSADSEEPVEQSVEKPREEPVEQSVDASTADAGTAADPDQLSSDAPPDPDPDSEVPRDPDSGASRPVRHRSPLAVAAVAAAVLLVGGGGAYFATTASGGSDGDTTAGASGDDTPPLLALDGYTESGGTNNGIAPGEPNPYGMTYRVAGDLPAGPGSAAVYRAQGPVTEAEVARLAGALGVTGKPVVQGQVWLIGGQDGSGPRLQVNRQAPGAWTFQRYSPVIDNCRSETVCADKSGASTDTTGDPVSEAVAEKAAAPVLKALGQDDAKLDASQVMGADRVVNADPVVGGLPTYGWMTGITVNGQGEVVGGTGQLKTPVKSDTYPVLSAEKTLGLLNKAPGTDHRMGIGGCATPVPLKDRLEAPCGESTASPAASTLTVEKAVFGLASHLVDGRQALVPSWLFEVRASGGQDPFTMTYPAIDPKYLASSATAAPTEVPTAGPTSPSDEPTSAPKTRDVKVDGYSVDGDELTVSFTGGVCGDYAASASESSGEVTVKVTETPWRDKVCIMIAKEMQQTVPLDGPLDGRKVVGSDGKEIPLKKAGARLPETSGAR